MAQLLTKFDTHFKLLGVDASPQPKQTKLIFASRPHSKHEQTLMGVDASPQPKETNQQNIAVQQFLFLIMLVHTLCLEQ